MSAKLNAIRYRSQHKVKAPHHRGAFFQGEGWGGVCFLACETSNATPSQPPPWQGEELFEAFFGIDLTYRPKMCIRDRTITRGHHVKRLPANLELIILRILIYRSFLAIAKLGSVPVVCCSPEMGLSGSLCTRVNIKS